MKTHERSFRLEASEGLGAKPRPELIGPVLAHLHDTLQDSVRMGFLHSSRARGRVPASLRLAADVRYIGHSADGDTATLLHFQVPSFGEAAADLYRQQSLWEDGPQPDQTAFELLGAALNDVAARCADSNRFDSGLLHRLARYRRMFGRGHLDRIALPDVALSQPGQLDASVAESAKAMYSATPPSRRVRIAGRLDVLGVSQGILKLDLGNGNAVTALWEGDADVVALRDHLNQDVVIEGSAIFRPSGGLLRVDASAIAAAAARDNFFRVIPSGVLMQDVRRAAHLRPGEKSVYARIFGRIPAEETEEEFAAAIEAMS